MGMPIEVVFALPGRCWRWPLALPEGATVGDALRSAPLAEAGLDPDALPAGVGVFGREVALTRVLRPHERVEIYRTLLCDPKQVRRERAERDRSQRGRRRE